MKPTQSHRPAVWECMLGTLHAMNDEGERRYFDYKWDEAFAFAGYTEGRDPRVWKAQRNMGLDGPSRGQLVLWLKRQEA